MPAAPACAAAEARALGSPWRQRPPFQVFCPGFFGLPFFFWALGMAGSFVLALSASGWVLASPLAPRAVTRLVSVMSGVPAAAPGAQDEDPIFQYIVLRRDLQEKQQWPLGSLVAQGCHAAVAAVVEHMDDDDVKQYVAPGAIDGMHKAVVEVKGEAQLMNLSSRLREAGLQHKLWVEQPENVATALACKPARKSTLQPHFKKCQLSTWHAVAEPPASATASPAAGAPTAD